MRLYVGHKYCIDSSDMSVGIGILRKCLCDVTVATLPYPKTKHWHCV